MSVSPKAVHLITYRVGFGDCFLLRFDYAKGPRHVLIDFGTTASADTPITITETVDGKTKKRKVAPMVRIAEDIARRCREGDGRLDAIVATHRHQDHISGFAGESWKVLAALKPKLVLLPWTEHPDAKVSDKKAPRVSEGKLGLQSFKQLRSLKEMQALAQAALDEVGKKGPKQTRKSPAAHDDGHDDADTSSDPEPLSLKSAPFGVQAARSLRFMGENNLSNAEAVKNLMGVPARDYLSFGKKPRLKLPGVQVDVLGPPLLEDVPGIIKQRDEDPEQFWHLARKAVVRSSTGKRLFPRATVTPESRLPLETRWFLRRMDRVRGDQLLELVRIMDDAMNNTSLILLFTVNGKRLLFPGDAQIENWAHALSQPKVIEKLKKVDVYKVGHHGSLNATPKSLWALFEKRGAQKKLKSFLSTKNGKHGTVSSGTEVPRTPLVEALQKETDLLDTRDRKKNPEFWTSVQIA